MNRKKMQELQTKINVSKDFKPIIFFDSGLGGLSVLREARLKMPGEQFIYIADDANFPYGSWQEKELKEHIINLFKNIILQFNPKMCVLACNTASTLVLKELRELFPTVIFVGTVPAIKRASENSASNLISVLATPSTVKRDYTINLISQYAGHCSVNLVGSENLAKISEDYLKHGNLDKKALLNEIKPCFIEQNGKKTDIIVLACTHYPFLINQMRNLAPWPVDWYDPSESIALQIKKLLEECKQNTKNSAAILDSRDLALFTSNNLDDYTKRFLQVFGLSFSKYNFCKT